MPVRILQFHIMFQAIIMSDENCTTFLENVSDLDVALNCGT